MLKNIKIENYNGIKNIFLDNFQKINIFVGRENTGKTSVLEAIHSHLLKEYENEKHIVKIIYYDKYFSIHMENKLKFILEVQDKKENLLKYVCRFFTDVKDIILVNDRILVQLDTLINLDSMGSGFKNILYIIITILMGEKYIIIDEIENGLHYSHFSLLLELLFIDNDIQFFVTTHNIELLESLSDTLNHKKSRDSISVFNLYRDKYKDIRAIYYNQEAFIFNIENGNEIRN